MNAAVGHQTSARLRKASGFTLTELMVTLALTALISGGVLASQLYGMRMTELTQTKIHTSDQARQMIRLLTKDIHTARLVLVGNGSASSFTEAAIDAPQQGNAIQLYPEENTNVFVRYFRNASDQKLKRLTNTGKLDVVANAVTNQIVFTAEDFGGNVLFSHQQNAAIAVDCRFNQLKNPDLPVGPQYYYKWYRLQTRIAMSSL